MRVRTWFDQPARKLRRRKTRAAKGARAAPRPVDGALRPVVRCQTAKYNTRSRLGRGFTLAELKEAGIAARLAPTIGIAVDKRRRNCSVEGLQANVQRLKEYKAKLIVFPRKPGKVKPGDSDAAATSVAATLPKGALLPLEKPTLSVGVEPLTDELKGKAAYRTLRLESTNLRYKGIREKRAADAAAEAEEKKK